jgi:hypothetical protein
VITQASPTEPTRTDPLFPRAVTVIRAATGASHSSAVSLATALGRAGILAQSAGAIVLRRGSAGQWTTEPRTDLETQALEWDAALGRAARLAEQIRTEVGGELAARTGLMTVRADAERVLVTAQITHTGQWAGWCRYLGITSASPGSPEHAYIGRGYRNGVGVTVIAYDAPATEARTAAAATMPHRYGGYVLDLALPLRDAHGEVWDYRELRADGMPLLTRRDDPTGGRCTLAGVDAQVGPLDNVRSEALPSGGAR